jgi:hypothetical protein
MGRIAVLGFLLLPALSSGCLAVGPPPLEDPYYEHRGMWCGNYAIDPERARVAALATLTELGMPVYREGVLPHGYFVDTRTPENFEARVLVMPVARHGGDTRVGVRIGGFGTHREVCAHLLAAIARHIEVVRQLPPVPPAPVPSQPVVQPGPPPVTAVPPGPPAEESALPPQPIPVK